MARLVIAAGSSPLTMGSVSTLICSPRIAKLLLRGRSAGVKRGHDDLLLVTLQQPLGDLGGRGGLAGTLQTDHQDRYRWCCLQVEWYGVLAQHLDDGVIDDLDDHLAGLDRLDDFLADRTLFHLLDEVAHNLKCHVCFDQRAAHLSHGDIDVGLGQGTPAGQLVKDATQAVLKCFKHSFFL